MTFKTPKRAIPQDLWDDLGKVLEPGELMELHRKYQFKIPTGLDPVDADPIERHFSDDLYALDVEGFVKKSTRAPETNKTYAYCLVNVDDYMRQQGIQNVGDLTVQHLEHLFTVELLTYSMRENRREYNEVRPSSWSGSHKNTLVQALKAYMRWELGDKDFDQHELARMSKSDRKFLGIRKQDRKRKLDKAEHWLTPEQLECMADAALAKGGKFAKRDRAILLLLWASAIRCTELTSIQVETIDQDAEPPTFEVYAKGGDYETCYIIDPTGEAIKALRAWLVDRRIRFKMDPESGDLFVNGGGSPLTRHGVLNIVNRNAELCGVKTTVHSFRRGSLRNMRDVTGCTYEDLAVVSRHKNIDILRDYLEGEDKDQAAKRVLDAFK